jgi:hypothetical protein
MSPESAGSMGLGAPSPPGQGWPAESPNAPDAPDAPDPFEAVDEPDPDWPGDWPDEDQRAAPGIGPPRGRAGAGGPPGRPRLLAVTAVAIAALAAGAGVALAVTKGLSPAPASSTPSSPPAAAAPSFAAPGGNGRGGPVPGGGTGGVEQLVVGGKVLAVSGSSITVGGPGRKITAAVTRSTRFTGRVSGIQGVKDGDLVTAQITQSGGAATVTALQDPADLPQGGSVP